MLLNYFYDPTILVVASLIMLMALIFHNMFQAWVAKRLGDPTPTYQGFGQFDPKTHLEPMGLFFLLLLGFGWTRQVPVNSRNYPGRGRKEALVWYAGPVAFLLVATLAWFLTAAFALAGAGPSLVSGFAVAGNVAVLHAVIHLFPIFPLDGARAAMAWGGPQVRRLVQRLAQFGVLGFVVIFFLLSYSGITGAIVLFFRRLILGGIELLFRAFGA